MLPATVQATRMLGAPQGPNGEDLVDGMLGKVRRCYYAALRRSLPPPVQLPWGC